VFVAACLAPFADAVGAPVAAEVGFFERIWFGGFWGGSCGSGKWSIGWGFAGMGTELERLKLT